MDGHERYPFLFVLAHRRGSVLDRGVGAVPLAAVLCLSALLDFLALGRQSFWLDEIYTYYFATLPGCEFWRTMVHGDANMILYYVVLRGWLVGGDTELWIRSLSALMTVAAVGAVYVLAARLFGRRAGLIGAVLLAINPLVVAYAQEARSYALFLFLTVVSTLLFVRALERSLIADWIAYVVVASLAVYSHFFALLVVVSHGVSLLFWRHSPLPWRRLIMAGIAFGLLLSPVVALVITTEGKLGWVSPPGVRHIAGVFVSLAGGKWLLVAYASLLIVAVRDAVRQRATGAMGPFWSVALLTAWLGVPVAIAFVVSLAARPVLVDRFFITGVAPLLILVAAGVDRIRSRSALTIVLIAIGSLSIPPLLSHYGSEKENWRGMTALVTARAREKDAVVFYTDTGRHAFAYYLRQQHTTTPGPAVASLPREMRAPASDESRHAFVRDLVRDHQRVWLVLSHVDVRARHVVSKSLEDALGSIYRSVREWRLQGVRVLLYHREASGESGR